MAVKPDRNSKLVDLWSLTHFGWGVLGGWLLHPLLAISLLILWEPLEILVISPIAHKYTGIVFGHETLKNSLSDIVFDSLGVLTALLLFN